MSRSKRSKEVRVIERKDTRGGTVFGVEYYDQNGKRSRRYNQEWTKSKAVSEAARLERMALHGINPSEDTAYTVAHLYDDWMQKHVEVACSEKTRIGYETEWRLRIEPTLGTQPVSQLGKDAVRHMIAEGKKAGDSASSLNAATAVLSSMLAHAVDAGQIDANPVHGLKRQPRKRRTAISWSRENVEAVAVHSKDERGRLLILLAYYTGIRSGELRALKWSSINEEWIRVHQAVCPATNALKSVKTGNERMVPIIPQARRVLDALALLNDEGVSPDGLLFPTLAGTPMNHSNMLNRWFIPARTAAGKNDPRLGTMRFHELRHSWVSLMLSTGVAPATVASWSGHTIDVMMKSYAHAIPMRVSVAQLGEAFV